MVKFTVPTAADGLKLRCFLKQYAQVSTTLWKKIKWHGGLQINGQSVNGATSAVQAGDTVCYRLPPTNAIIPYFAPLDIIYEDEWLLVINKPADLVIHPTSLVHSDTLVNIVAGYYQTSGQQTGCHPVYRLDRDTTGLIVVAKRPQIQFALTRTHDAIERYYTAFIAGTLTPRQGCLADPIGRQPGSIIKRCVTPDGQPALTEYLTVRTAAKLSELRLRLRTGRTHQIRVHLAHAGFPLLGDDLYGGSCQLLGRQALHAAQVAFTHPITGEALHFTAPLPDDLKRLAALF